MYMYTVPTRLYAVVTAAVFAFCACTGVHEATLHSLSRVALRIHAPPRQ